MEILSEDLRRQLPPIRKLHNPAADGQCIIYARLFTQHTGVSFYVAEGEQRNTDYLVWGLLITPGCKFPLKFQLTLGRLQTKDWIGKEPCRRDLGFQPACWETVERTIPQLRRPLKQGAPPLSATKVRST